MEYDEISPITGNRRVLIEADPETGINSRKVAQVIPLNDKEKLNYPIPGTDTEYYSSRLDVENAATFDKFQFKAALDQCYIYAKENGDWSPIQDASHIQKD